jgi:hypothetical protein
MRISEQIEKLKSLQDAYGDLRIMKAVPTGDDRHLERVEECGGLGVNRVLEVYADDFVVFNEEDEKDSDLVVELEDMFDDEIENILPDGELVVIPSGGHDR